MSEGKVAREIIQMRDTQGLNESCDFDPYMRGLYNGLELAASIADDHEPVFKAEPKIAQAPTFAVTGAFDNTITTQPSLHTVTLSTVADLAAQIIPRETETALTAAREQGAREEKARILALLERCRPTEQPYSRRDWALEERGKRELFDKIMKALGVQHG